MLEHSELGRAAVPASKHHGRTIAVWLSPVVALWLVGYALIFLRGTLGSSYGAQHWNTTWIGLDLAMAGLAVATWWLARRRSTIAVLTSTALATLLVADAWFDCLTANAADRPLSLLSLAGELPAAACYFWIAGNLARGG